MGTRALLHILNEDKKTLTTIYTHWDGQPSGFGKRIKKILNDGDVEVVDGLQDHRIPQNFNGMGCLAAYLVGQLKGCQIGSVYMLKPNTKEAGQDYVYKLWCENSKLFIKIVDFNSKTIYKGLLSTLDLLKEKNVK